jgi:hypothetical protein
MFKIKGVEDLMRAKFSPVGRVILENIDTILFKLPVKSYKVVPVLN